MIRLLISSVNLEAFAGKGKWSLEVFAKKTVFLKRLSLGFSGFERILAYVWRGIFGTPKITQRLSHPWKVYLGGLSAEMIIMILRAISSCMNKTAEKDITVSIRSSTLIPQSCMKGTDHYGIQAFLSDSCYGSKKN